MSLIEKLKPEFWDESIPAEDSDIKLFDYAKVWKYAVVGASTMALLPLIIMFFLNHYQYKKAFEGQLLRPFYCFVSNTQQSISSFISQKKMALYFIAEDNPFKALTEQRRLVQIFSHLKKASGEFEDLSIIDSKGILRTYAGPDRLRGRNSGNQHWIKEVKQKGAYVGEIRRNFDGSHYFVVAIQYKKDNEEPFVLRASLKAQTLEHLIKAQKLIRPSFDSFIINQEAVLQTSSRFYGKAFERLSLPLGSLSDRGEVQELKDKSGRSIILTSMVIEGTPFRFMAVAPREALTGDLIPRGKLFAGFLVISMLSVLIIVIVVVTHLVGRVYKADRGRVSFLHNIQYTNKMASIGRLAAGVAHEINNPLAIINENAGLLRDSIILKKEFSHEKFLKIVDSILSSVDRCGAITHRLLGFARHIDIRFETIHLKEVIKDILLFFGKESEYRRISVNLCVPEDLEPVTSDLGQLEQVFFNILNNAFAAVDDGGRIDIEMFVDEPKMVGVRITDDGCGISEKNLKHIFDPFFSTRGEKGSGLGLSITYGIVQKLGGKVKVKSKKGEGSSFTVILPIKGNK